jgi:hypothetical protein
MRMKREHRASVGVTPETAEKIKQIIEITGEKHYRMIDRLISEELRKQVRKLEKKAA